MRKKRAEHLRLLWASKSAEELRQHGERTKAGYRLKHPAQATWPERWIADAMAYEIPSPDEDGYWRAVQGGRI